MTVTTRSGQHWLITGVSSGFGRALAEAALARGDQVTGTVRTEAARLTFETLAPGRAQGRLLDITDDSAVRATITAIAADHPIDILVNNAGYGLVAGVEEATPDEIRAQFAVNVFGTLAVTQALLPFMRARRHGRIITISSVSGLVGWPSLGVYSGSKFAVEGIMETLALELAPCGVHVTLVEPGGFRTQFATGSRIESARQIADYDSTVGACRRILAAHAGREPGDPAKAAQAILAVADAVQPPLRLLLGRDAVQYVISKEQAVALERAAWISVVVSTDASDAAM